MQNSLKQPWAACCLLVLGMSLDMIPGMAVAQAAEKASPQAGTTAVSPPEEKKVYQRRKADGSVEFSDVPVPGATEIKVREMPTYKAPKYKTLSPGSKGAATARNKPAPPPYDFRLTAPAPETAIRENAGNVKVTVAIKPALRRGHQIVFILDGKASPPLTTTGYTFKNVSRGEHTVSAQIRTRSGQTLMRTKPVRFTLLRYSALHPKP